jgi:hypothetical protein
MSQIILLYSNNEPIPLTKFVATWKIWVEEFYPGINYKTFCMPQRNAAQNLQKSLEQGLAPCLDVMCRLLASSTYVNRMQATNDFMKMNSKWLSACRAISPAGRNVAGASLTALAIFEFENCEERIKKQFYEEGLRLLSIAKINS